MRGNEFLDKMELVDAAFVEAADRASGKKRLLWLRSCAVAACLLLVLFVGRGLLPQKELPLLTLSLSNNGMGFEGYGAYDISDLANANPWSEDQKLSTLPVYKNTITYDQFHIASGSDPEKMKATLLDIADRLGLDTDSLTITDDSPDEETKKKMIEGFKMATRLDTVPDGYFDPAMLTIETEGLKLEVDQSLTVTISFDPPISLPEDYNFTHHAAYGEAEAVAEYLKEEYKDLVGFDEPMANIAGGDRNIYGLQNYHVEFYDAGGSYKEDIVNYNFNRVAFYCNDEGKLFLARVFQPDLSHKVGDYPIITVEEAKELLAKGSYITTVPYELPGMDYVKKAELVYRNDREIEYFMPYYRFYVELPEMEREGMKTFGAYYVPAVAGEYIANMPLWDGSFN